MHAIPHPNPTHSFRAIAQTDTTVVTIVYNTTLFEIYWHYAMLILLLSLYKNAATMCKCCACKQCYYLLCINIAHRV